MKPCSLCCLLALLLAAPLRAAPPPPTLVLQVGHSAAITSVAYSPDGQSLVTGAASGGYEDDFVRLWDTASGQVMAILPTGGENALVFAFAPDSKTLATWDEFGDGTAQLWDVPSGLPKPVPYAATAPFAFSPDGKTLATGGSDSNGNSVAQLWDVASWQLKVVLQAGNVYSLAYSSDSKTLAIGTDDGRARLWDAASGQVKAILKPDLDLVDSLAFSADGKALATGGLIQDASGTSGPGSVQLWDGGSGLLKMGLDGAFVGGGPFAFSPDGKTLASGGDLWDVASGQLKAALPSSGPVIALAFDGQTLATVSRFLDILGASHLGPLVFWDAASGNEKWDLGRRSDGMGDIALSPDGKALATVIENGSMDGYTVVDTVQLWGTASGQLQATLNDQSGPLAFSPDGQTLATGASSGVRLWAAASGQLKAILKDPGWPFEDLVFAPDGKTLATVSDTGTTAFLTVRLWDVACGQLQTTLKDAGWLLAFSPDSKMLATGASSGVRLWDVAGGQLKATQTLTDGDLRALAFSPNGKTLATMSKNETTQTWSVRLWDVAGGQFKAVLSEAYAAGDALPLTFSPDGQTVAIAGYNTTPPLWTVQLWDTGSGQLQATLKNASGPLVFSPDSKTLATQDGDGVGLWEVASGQLKATLKDAPQFAFSADSQTLATRDFSGHLDLWDAASASPITITAQTSLAQFPLWLTHPLSWVNDPAGVSLRDRLAVSLLDPVDEHVLATLQALPDAPASLFAPLPDPAAVSSTGREWITTTPDGYFEGSANLAQFIRWNVDGVLYPAAAYWDLYYRPDLVQQALRIPAG